MAFDGALEAAAAVRSGAISPLELLDDCLVCADRLDPELNALVWRDDARARDAARRAGDVLARTDPAHLPPFFGVPIPIKDMTPVAGWPTTYGSRGAAPGVSRVSAPVVDRLRAGGFVLAGRTNTSEFGRLPVAENSRYGVTRNPWDTSRTAGGSSGGAAAAVAAGMFPVAHGNDGGGSIRVPASCTGLVGLKAGRGRVPACAGHSDGMCVEGVLTRTVRDAAAVLDVISRFTDCAGHGAPRPADPFALEPGRDPGRLRIGVKRTAPFTVPVAAVCTAAVDEVATTLSDAGHFVVETDLELLTGAALTAFVRLRDAGLAAVDDVDWGCTEPHVSQAYERGRALDGGGRAGALAELTAYSRALVASWQTEFDVLLSPTMAIPPPVAGDILAGAHADPRAASLALVQMTLFTTPANIAGLPAISLPTHQAPDGVPIGVMLVAGAWQEPTLLRLSAQVEQLLPWGDRRPPTCG